MALHRLGGQGIAGNHIDSETRDEYWISGIKKDQSDRHRCGSGKIMVASDVVAEYLELVGRGSLDKSKFEVTADILKTDVQAHHQRENRAL